MEGIENFKFDNEKDKEKLKKTYQKLIKEREKVNDSGVIGKVNMCLSVL